MKKIYKYDLSMKDKQIISLPLNSKILSVKNQYEGIVLYALVDTEREEQEKHSIIIHGTGHSADDVEEYNFLGTVKLENGRLMFHVFYT